MEGRTDPASLWVEVSLALVLPSVKNVKWNRRVAFGAFFFFLLLLLANASRFFKTNQTFPVNLFLEL